MKAGKEGEDRGICMSLNIKIKGKIKRAIVTKTKIIFLGHSK